MNLLRKLPVIFGTFFLVIGLLLFIADIYHLHRYGIDIFSGNSYVTEDGQVADAPEEAGGAPIFFWIPAYVYSLMCWVMAAVAFAFLPFVGNDNLQRSRNGME